MNKKSIALFVLLVSGITLLTGSSAASIMYNSHYINYNYLATLNLKQNSKTLDDPDSSDASITKKPKRSRAEQLSLSGIKDSNDESFGGETNAIMIKKPKRVRVDPTSDAFSLSANDKFATFDVKTFLEDDLSLGQIQNDLTNTINDLTIFTNKIQNNIQIQNIVVDSLHTDQIANNSSHAFSSDQNQIILLLSISVSGFIIIRSEGRLKIKSKKIISSAFIIIFTASIVTTPLSISSNYWGYAYAETNATSPIITNSTDHVSMIENSTHESITPEHIQMNFSTMNTPIQTKPTANGTELNHTSFEIFSIIDTISVHKTTSQDLSQLEQNDSKSLNDIISMSDSLQVISGNNTTYALNSTNSPGNLTARISISDTINATVNYAKTNGTQTTGIIQSILPNATKSFNFTSLDGTVGKTDVQNSTLQLQGEGYVTQNVNSTNNIKNFTISALVQPDYSQGSAVFTIISKHGQFALTINNAISPKGIAQFSIFDGIRWNTVNSTGTIQDWTHLAVTYNSTDIAIYVNGTKQSSMRLPGVLTISDDGHLTPVMPDHLTSNYDVVIGATIDTTRNYAKDKFSGQIKDVNFYNTLLDQSQIQQLYQRDTAKPSTISTIPMAENLSISDSILALNAGINGTGVNSTSINGTNISTSDINATGLPVVPTITTLKSSYAIGDNPEFEFKIFKDSDIKKLKTVKAGMQQGRWNDKNITISIKVIAPDGTEIPLKSEFKKMKEGKFDIKILSKKYGKPGVYTIQTTLVQNGKTYTTQDQYAWGLVSLNTDKSIYVPGQTANMTMVVLDSGGHPVCDANLSILVTDPASHITTLMSGVGVTAGSECGIYNTNYATTVPGNYTVNVSATANSIKTDFNTSFLVQNNFAFDIIRTAQSKIDPINNPNNFNVKIDVTSFTNATNVTIKESVPSVLNVITDANVQVVGDSKILTWNKSLIGNKASIQYSYSVPLVFPQLYALGPVQISYGNQTFTEARQWFVANDPPPDTIQFDGVPTSQGFSTTATNTEKNMSLTIGGNANRLLLVQVVLNSATAVIDVSWKGIHLTPIETGNVNSSKTIQFFYLANPPTGTDNVVVDTTVDLSTKGVIGAYSLYGVDQTTPVIKSGTNTKATSTAPSITLTNSRDNSMLIDLAENPSSIFNTSSCPTCTIAWNNNGGASTIQAGSQWMRTTTAGTSTAFSWTFASSKAWIMTGVEVIPAGIIGENETLSISDQITTQLISSVSSDDSISINDQVYASKLFTTSNSDQVSISDQLSTLLTRNTYLSDSVSVSDQSTALHFNEHYYDGLPVTVTTSPTSLASFTPSIPAGDNLVIVSAQFDGTSTTSMATVSSGNLQLKKDGVTLTSNPFDINVEGDTQGTKQASTILFYKDVDASANPTYDVTSLASQNISGKVTILVIHEAPNFSFGNSTVIALPSAQTTIFSHTPSMSSGNNLILADINLHNTAGAARTFAASAIDIERSGNVLSSNQNSLQLDASTAVINSHSILLIANDTNAPANPTYDITTKPSSTGVNGQVQIFVIQGLSYSFVDSGNTALTTTDSTLGSANIATNSATDKIAVIAGVETKSGTTSLRTINPGSLKLSTSGITQSSNEFGMELKSAGTQFRDHVLLYSNSYGQNPTFDVIESQTSATSVNAEAKMVAINLNMKSISLTDGIGIVDSVQSTAVKRFSLSDSLGLSDTLTTSAAKSTSLSDTILLADTLTTSATKSQSLSDTILLADTLTTRLTSTQKSLSDTILLADSVIVQSTLIHKSLSDTILLADTLTTRLTSTQKSLSDTILLADSVTTSATRSRSFSDTIPLADSVTSLENLAANQQLVEDTQKQIIVDPNKPQLVVTSSSAALSNVTIPSTVTTSQLNYTLITSGGSATIDNAVTISKDTNGDKSIEVKVTLPSSTTITGTSWNGVLELPKVTSSTDLTFPVSSGQVATAGIVIDVGSSTSLTFNQPVRMLFLGQAGKQVGFFHNTNTVTEITATCTSDSISGMPSGSNECKINVGSDMVIWTKHFTGFGTWGSSSSSSGKGAGGGAGGGGGGYGTGYEVPSQYGSTEGEIVANLTSSLKILSISYDTCDTNMAKILVSYSDNNPNVILRTSVTGVVNAVPAKVQPYATENENATVKRLVYEAPIRNNEKTFEVLALQAIGHDIISVGQTMTITGCHEEKSFEGEPGVIPKQIGFTPRIFDLKFQINNGTKIPSAEDNHYITPQQVTVSGIVDSKTALDSAELRFVKAGDLASNYIAVKMDVTPIQITNSTYVISGTIPKDAIQAPGVLYWIVLYNAAGKTESVHYGIGIKPAYQANGKLEIDVRPTRVDGTLAHPTAYFTNTATGPVYGSVSLLIDGNVVYNSPAQVFSTGENTVNLQWKSPTVGHISQHIIQAKVELYGQSFETVSSSITTFPGTLTLPLSSLNNIETITVDNHTIAKALVLHSSFNNKGTMQFKVTAPDGTCVIGDGANCLVTQSTMRHGIKSVTIGDQIFRVRYSGSNVPLERFSITSVDPISGNWKVEVDSKTGLVPMADAANDVMLKVKYYDVDINKITIR